MQFNVNEVAKKTGVPPQTVLDVTAELGITVSDGQYEADSDTQELIEDSCREQAPDDGSAVSMPKGRTPRDIATALGVPDKEVILV